jgi:hypothetical protein
VTSSAQGALVPLAAKLSNVCAYGSDSGGGAARAVDDDTLKTQPAAQATRVAVVREI